MRVADPETIKDWDERLLQDERATFFHSRAWTRVLQQTYRYRPQFLVDFTGDQLLAVPMMEVASFCTGKRGIALPFTDECPALIPKGCDGIAVLDKVLSHGRAQRWRYFESRGWENDQVKRSISFYRHTLQLRKDSKKMLDNCDGAVRRAIRKSGESNLRLEQAHSPAAMNTFFGLHEKTRRKHGLPPQPLTFFKSIQKEVLARGLGDLFIAWYRSIPVAAALFFHFGGKAIYKFGASDPAFLEFRGNNAVIWEAIRSYAERNFSSLSFGRTELGNEGLRRFKLNWGTVEEPLHYSRFDFAAGQFITILDQTKGWYNQVFRAAPLFVSRSIGSLMYRHIA